MQMRHIVTGASLALALAVPATQPAAHHAFSAEYDANRPVTLRGTIVQMEWINPHTWMHVDVEDEDGTVTRWMIEGGTPNTLMRRGFTRESVQAGTEIVVEGYRAPTGANRANGRDLILPDGSRLFMGSSGTGAPRDGRDPDEQ
jgi:DNA/RNA endonuclease YhcR with UshA esterase domain